jgi:hypothetical protein
MVLLASLWDSLWSLFPLEVQTAYDQNTKLFVFLTAALILAFLALPCASWARGETTIAGKYRARGRGRRAVLLLLGIGLALLSPYAAFFLIRLLNR